MKALLALFLVLAAPVAGQTKLYSVGPGLPEGAGTRSASVSDLNGDGVADFVVSNAGESVGGTAVGVVRVVSGADAAVIVTLSGTTPGGQFGKRIAALGDVDGDGIADVGITSVDPAMRIPIALHVYSGRTLARIRLQNNPTTEVRFGDAIGGMGDVDADGRDDYFVSNQSASGATAGDGSGAIYIYSGGTGSLIRAWRGQPFQSVGFRVLCFGDADGDGVGDLWSNIGSDSWEVRSGATLALLHAGANRPTLNVCALGDVDGDGLDDYALGSGNTYSANRSIRGLVEARSGRTGAVLWTVWNERGGQFFPTQMALLGDLDGDGKDEFAAAATEYRSAVGRVGFVRIYRPADGSVLTNWEGTVDGGSFGATISGLPDVNADGFDDVLIGSYNTSSRYYDVSAYSYGATGSPAWSRKLGAPCAGSNGALPRIDQVGELRFGTACALHLRTALPNAPTVLALAAPVSFAGAAFGAPGCTMLAGGDGFNVMRVVGPDGRASVESISIPVEPSLTGAVLRGQWFTMDAGANALGVSFSDALEMRFGT